MKKSGIIFLALGVLCAVFPAFARSDEALWDSWRPQRRWSIGLSGGFAYNTLYTGGLDKVEPFKEYEPGWGWTLGLPVRFYLFNWLAAQVEPSFITKNYRVGQTGIWSDLYDEYSNSFVDLPLLLHFRLEAPRTGLSLFANGGGFLGLWAASRRSGRAQTITGGGGYTDAYSEDYAFDSRYDNRFDGGLLLGLGVQYDINRVSIFAEGRFAYSLTDLHQTVQRNQMPYMNDTWTIQAGVLFNF